MVSLLAGRRRGIRGIVAVLGALALAGCGGPASPPTPNPPVATQTPEPVAVLPTPFPTPTGGPGFKPGPVPTQGEQIEGTPFVDDDMTPGAYTVAGPEAGQPAPDITLISLETGAPLQLSEFKGKPVWLNFWATWCGPCKQEMPEMQQIFAQQRTTDLVILGVDVGEDPDTVRAFVTPPHFGWTFALDPDNRASFAYTVLALPAHVFIRRDGTIQATVISGLTRADMDTQVQRLLATK